MPVTEPASGKQGRRGTEDSRSAERAYSAGSQKGGSQELTRYAAAARAHCAGDRMSDMARWKSARNEFVFSSSPRLGQLTLPPMECTGGLCLATAEHRTSASVPLNKRDLAPTYSAATRFFQIRSLAVRRSRPDAAMLQRQAIALHSTTQCNRTGCKSRSHSVTDATWSTRPAADGTHDSRRVK